MTLMLTGALVNPVVSVTTTVNTELACRQGGCGQVTRICTGTVALPVGVPKFPSLTVETTPSSRSALMCQLMAFPFASVTLNCSMKDLPFGIVHCVAPLQVKLVTTGAAPVPGVNVRVRVGVLVGVGVPGASVGVGEPDAPTVISTLAGALVNPVVSVTTTVNTKLACPHVP